MTSRYLATIILMISLIHDTISTSFKATGLPGFDITIQIDTKQTTVTVFIDGIHASSWYGIGFGSITMKNTYAIITTPTLPNPTSTENKLTTDSSGQILDGTASNWIITDLNTSSNQSTLTMIRDNDIKGGYYTFNPLDTTIDIIYAIGTDGILNNGHSPDSYGTYYYGEQLQQITAAPTQHPTTSIPTVNPTTTTAIPTAYPTAPTTTTAIPTAYPTTATPTDTPTTTATPTSYPTTSAPTTTAIPTANPITTAPTGNPTKATTTALPTTSTSILTTSTSSTATITTSALSSTSTSMATAISSTSTSTTTTSSTSTSSTLIASSLSRATTSTPTTSTTTVSTAATTETAETTKSEKDDIKIINATRVVYIYHTGSGQQSQSALPSTGHIAMIGVVILGVLFCCTLCILVPLGIIYIQKETKKNNSHIRNAAVNHLRIGGFSGEFDLETDIDPQSPGTITTNAEDDDIDDDDNDVIDDEINGYHGIVFNVNARQNTDTSALYGFGGNDGYGEGDIVTRKGNGSPIMSPSVDAMTSGMSRMNDDDLDLKEEYEEESITETMDMIDCVIKNVALPISPLNSHKSRSVENVDVDDKEYKIDLGGLLSNNSMIKIDEDDEMTVEDKERGILVKKQNISSTLSMDSDGMMSDDSNNNKKYSHLSIASLDTDNMDIVMEELEISVIHKKNNTMTSTMTMEEEQEEEIIKTQHSHYLD